MLLWLCTPETFGPTLLYRRAARLRKLTGNPKYRAASELSHGDKTTRQMLNFALAKPIEITILDPSIGFVNLYTMYVYGTYYSFFEAFPIVFSEIHGFDLGQLGLAYITISVGAGLGVVVSLAHGALVTGPRIEKKGMPPQEFFLIPALYASFLIPVSLFWFAWTSRPDIHWISPMLAIVLYAFSSFLLILSIFAYLPLSYPQYAASL